MIEEEIFLQRSAVEVNANLSTAAIVLQFTRACFISCEGVLNLRMAGALAHGLFPCCLGNRVPGQKMSISVALWARRAAVWALA